MKTTAFASLAFVAISHMLTGVMADTPSRTDAGFLQPSKQAISDQQTSQGCFKSPGNFTEMKLTDPTTGKNIASSLGGCWPVCKEKKYWAMALHGDKCLCGMVYPEVESITKDVECSFPCIQGGFEPCGNIKTAGKGIDRWSVYNLGVETNVDYYVPEKEEEKSTTSSAAGATKTNDQSGPDKTGNKDSTTTEDPPKDENDGGDDKKDGPNVAGIAAGVVVGVVAMGALIGATFFYMRRKRNAEIEEEHRRNAAVNAFISGAKPPGSSGGVSMSDSRLEPGLAHRRLSDGSIADNQDYSRKILRVTNA
jgi:cell wall integrity and stress response component